MSMLAASGDDTVKLLDASVKPGDPCTLSFTPSPDFQVNSVKWNHTNLVVASAGDDKRISLWRKNGHNMGTIPLAGTDIGDNSEGISRDSMHKRRATGGKKKAWRKKRKYELGRQPTNTKLSSNKTIRRIGVRGGNVKWRALRLDTENFSWGSETVSFFS